MGQQVKAAIQRIVGSVADDVKDIAERALWTAVEVFVVLVTADGADWADTANWKKAALAALGAAVAAVKTGIKQRRAVRVGTAASESSVDAEIGGAEDVVADS